MALNTPSFSYMGHFSGPERLSGLKPSAEVSEVPKRFWVSVLGRYSANLLVESILSMLGRLNRLAEELMEVEEKIDVCVPSLQHFDEMFVQHLYEALPVHCLLTSSLRGRGKARQDLIQRVDTDWFVFVDTDVRLRPNWWHEVCKTVRNDIGAVEGLWSYALYDRRVDDYARAMLRLAKLLRRRGWAERLDRAFTGDTLIRTDAVGSIRIPDLPLYEDEYIRRHVLKAGYKWVRTPTVVCDHLRRYNLEEAYDSGKYAYGFGQTSVRHQLGRVALLSVKIPFAVASTGRLGIVEFALKKELRVLKGVLHAHVRRWQVRPD